MYKIILIVSLILSASVIRCSEHDVLTLDDQNFESSLSNHETTLVMFFAPWCRHCGLLELEFEEAAKLVKNNIPSITLAKIDCTKSGKETCDKFSISGYPTLKIFKSREFLRDYKGPHEADGIAKYMRRQIGPASKSIKALDELDDFLRIQEPILFGYFKDMETTLAKLFLKFADENREKYRFGHSNQEEVLLKAPKTDLIVLIRASHLRNKFEENIIHFEGTSEEDLSSFVKNNFHGLVGHRTEDNAHDFQNPLITAYYSIDYIKNPKGTNYWRNRILKVAKKFVGKLNFAISDKDDFEEELNEYNYNFIDNKPIILAHDLKNLKYVMTDEFSVDNLNNFAQNLLDSLLKPYIKSEPIPENNDAPVKIAVAANFDQMIMENGKDTFIEFYAPWCVHCKELSPIYDELAEKLKNEDVLIAKMDGTANDVPPKFNLEEGFPQLYWLPKHAKHAPVVYDEGEELNDFLKYIAKHATNELRGYDRDGNIKQKEVKVDL